MKDNNASNIIISISIYIIFIFLGIQLLNVKIYNLLSSFNLYVIFVFTIMIVLLNLGKVIKNKIIICTNFISIILVLIGGFQNAFGFGGLLIIINFLLVLLVATSIKIQENCIKYLFKSIKFYSIIYFFIAKDGFNKNTIGQIAFILFVYNLVLIIHNKDGYFSSIVAIVLCFVNIINSESRGVLIATVALCIIISLNKIIIDKKIVFGIIIIFLTFGSIIFCMFYVQLWSEGVVVNTIYTDKRFYSGREYIWYELINLIKLYPIWGVGSNYSINSFEVFNSHNSMLNIMVVYGIPTFILFNLNLINSLFNARKLSLKRLETRVALSGFLGILIIGFFETILIWGTIFFLNIFLLWIITSIGDEGNVNCIYTDL